MVRKIFLLIWMLSLTASVVDAAIIRLVDDGAGRYRLEGEGFTDVAAIDLTLEYDPDSLSVSSVAKGSLLQAVMFASNLNQAGVIRIGAIGTQSVNGSGDLAHIETVEKTDSAQFKSVTARLNDPKGESLAVTTLLIGLEETQDVLETEETTSSSSRIAGGVAGLPSDSAESFRRQNGRDDQTVGFTASSQRSSNGPRMTFVELREFAASSPVKLMAAYRGGRSFNDMAELFVRADKTIRQYPYPAISDGQTEIEIILPALHADLPSLALSNAKLIGSGFNEEGEWTVRCLPTRGAHTAKILVLGLEQLVEIPVVVAPAVDLKRYPLSSEGVLPTYDLDLDGEHTWLDDYTLVANLLISNSDE